MNYELALILKNAGFMHVCTQCCDHCHNEQGRREYQKNKFTDFICFPTLEELIDACGDDFFMLEHNSPSVTRTPHWAAFTKDLFWKAGSTPCEAVARLWLTINKKVKKQYTEWELTHCSNCRGELIEGCFAKHKEQTNYMDGRNFAQLDEAIEPQSSPDYWG